MTLFEDGSAIVTLFNIITIHIPAFDSAGDAIRIIIG